MPRSDIPDGEIHDAAAYAANAARYHMAPGIVTKFYPAVAGKSPPAVDVEVGVHDVRICVAPNEPEEGLVVGQRYREAFPVLQRVPVKFPTFGGFAMWGRLKVGNKVTLLAFDLDPSTFLATGQPSDPPLTRRNSGAHWVAVPGDFTDGGALPDPGDAICIGTPGGVLIAIDGQTVNLGAASATDAVALANLVKAELTKIATALSSLTVTTGPGSGGTVVAGSPYPTPGNVASGTVKCQP